MYFYQPSGIHLFFRLHSPGVLMCLKLSMTLKVVLTFWCLFAFHSIHVQGFYLLFGPFVGWKPSDLTPGRARCVLQVPHGPNFERHTVHVSRIWSNGHAKEDRCTTCKWAVWSGGIRFFEASFSPGGRTVALFMVAISTVNSCLMITDLPRFPQFPPPVPLPFHVSCSFAR